MSVGDWFGFGLRLAFTLILTITMGEGVGDPPLGNLRVRTHPPPQLGPGPPVPNVLPYDGAWPPSREGVSATHAYGIRTSTGPGSRGGPTHPLPRLLPLVPTGQDSCFALCAARLERTNHLHPRTMIYFPNF